MSRGFGLIERDIISYLENKPVMLRADHIAYFIKNDGNDDSFDYENFYDNKRSFINRVNPSYLSSVRRSLRRLHQKEKLYRTKKDSGGSVQWGLLPTFLWYIQEEFELEEEIRFLRPEARIYLKDNLLLRLNPHANVHIFGGDARYQKVTYTVE